MLYEVRGYGDELVGMLETPNAVAVMQALQRQQLTIHLVDGIDRPQPSANDSFGAIPSVVAAAQSGDLVPKKRRRKEPRIDAT